MTARIPYSTYDRRVFITGAICAAMIAVLAYMDLVSFDAWGQVTLLYGWNVPLWELTDHPHFYRFFVTLPGLWASDHFGYYLFSAYVGLYMVGTGMTVAFILKGLRFEFLLLALFFILPGHFFMNGRGVLGWFGWVLAIHLLLRPLSQPFGWREMVLLILSSLGATVSTGTFAVTFSAIIVGLCYRLYRTRQVRILYITLVLAALFTSYFIIAFVKNIEFYDYGGNAIVNILQHGMGEMFLSNASLIAVALGCLVVVPFVVDSLWRSFSFPEIVILIFPVVGGMFGFTTLTLALPAWVIILTRKLGIAFHRRAAKLDRERRNQSRPAPYRLRVSL